MYTPLATLVPNPDDLLALEVEEVAGVLLAHLNSYGSAGGGSGAVQHGRIGQYNFFLDLGNHPQYSSRQPEIRKVLMEA